MSVRQEFYLSLVVVATIWVLVSALGVVVSVGLGAKAVAWGWLASFALSALIAAYYFARLL